MVFPCGYDAQLSYISLLMNYKVGQKNTNSIVPLNDVGKIYSNED